MFDLITLKTIGNRNCGAVIAQGETLGIYLESTVLPKFSLTDGLIKYLLTMTCLHQLVYSRR